MDLPEDQVRILEMAYWNDVYEGILTMKSDVIGLKHIGLFTGSRYKINKYILKAIKKIRGIEKSKEYTEEVKQKILATKYPKLRQALKQRNILAIQYATEFGNI